MRKGILSLAIIMMAAICVNGQTEKGYWLIGGSAAFSSTSQTIESNKYTATTFGILPVGGYFIIDNLAVGAGISYLSQSSTSTEAAIPNITFSSTTTTSSTSFAFAPFIRYYFLPLGKSAKLYGNASFGFGSGSDKNAASSETISTTAWQIAAGPAFFLNKHTALEIALGYGANSEKENGTQLTQNAFEIEVGFQIHFKCNYKK
jgi:hypothetical protein